VVLTSKKELLKTTYKGLLKPVITFSNSLFNSIPILCIQPLNVWRCSQITNIRSISKPERRSASPFFCVRIWGFLCCKGIAVFGCVCREVRIFLCCKEKVYKARFAFVLLFVMHLYPSSAKGGLFLCRKSF